MREEKRRLSLLKALLQEELESHNPSLEYISDLQLSIERTEKEVAYQMVDHRVVGPTPSIFLKDRGE